jgi:hypothetical protein
MSTFGDSLIPIYLVLLCLSNPGMRCTNGQAVQVKRRLQLHYRAIQGIAELLSGSLKSPQ